MKKKGYSLKFGIAAEDALINYSGAVPASTKQAAEFIMAGRGEPYAELSMGALSLHVGAPVYYFTPFSSPSTDQNGVKNALKWMYKGIGLQYYTTYAAGTTGVFKISDNSNANSTILFTNYDSISYKIAVTKQFSVVPSVQADFIFSPAIAVNFGPVALFAQASYYPIAQGQGISVTTSSGATFNTYILTIDPKLTFSFDSLGVKGLSVFASSTIPIQTEFYYNKGLILTPGFSFKTGALSLEADLKMNSLDYASADGTK